MVEQTIKLHTVFQNDSSKKLSTPLSRYRELTDIVALNFVQLSTLTESFKPKSTVESFENIHRAHNSLVQSSKLEGSQKLT